MRAYTYIFCATRVGGLPPKPCRLRASLCSDYHRPKKGFTLIEIMVVLVIISIMAVLIVPNVISRPDDARMVVAKADIQAISNALELYKLDNSHYPSTQQGLDALVKKPNGTPEAKHWKTGGYLKKTPIDPWSNNYQYLHPGVHGTYDLWSFGPNGKQSGDDHSKYITN